MHSGIQHFTANIKGRDFAVGDIHGCFTLLSQALQQLKFNPKKDRLFSVGDLVDRGPESKAVLKWLAQPWFHPIQGNHEAMVIWGARGNPSYLADHALHGGAWFYKLPKTEQIKIKEAFERLPLIIEVETARGLVGLVHADFPYDDWKQMTPELLTNTAAFFCQWSRERLDHNYQAPIKNIRAVIHGHTPHSEMKILGNCFFIDTGGWSRNQLGHFTLLNLETLTPFYF